MKIVVISCYKDPDYVRSRVLRAGLKLDGRVKVIVVKNRFKNFLRYPEVLLKIFFVRIFRRPNVYLLTMRGEILPLLLLMAWPKPVVYDEMVNFIEWFVYEHRRVQPRSYPAQILASWYRSWLKRCELILADTKAHGAYSAALSGVSHSLYRAIPVGTDETIFKPQELAKKTSKKFEVFYYGSMLPLHGLTYVLEAAEQLRDNPDISFICVGGDKKTEALVQVAQSSGAKVKHKAWIPFNELPKAMGHADLCLAGPFGNTEQSKLVITGKTYQMLACAAPTVIGRTHASSVFTDKVDSLLVPQGDASALAAKIQWAYENRKKLEKIGKNGRKLYDKKFSNEVIAKKLSAIVDELAKSLADRARVPKAQPETASQGTAHK